MGGQPAGGAEVNAVREYDMSKSPRSILQANIFVIAVFTGAGCQAPAPSPTAAPAPAQPAATHQPTWVYDAPEYSRPASEPNVMPREHPQDPLHYYINRRLIHVRRPAPPASGDAPRFEVIATSDQGATWQQVGGFGIAQTFFPFEV